MNVQIIDHVLTINDTEVEHLPRLSAPARVDVWAVPSDYRNTGYFVSTSVAGQPRELPACAAADTEHIATLTLEPDADTMASEARAERLRQANDDADEMLAVLDAAYPEREVLTWDQQVKEAEALMADSEAETPLLQALAVSRDIDVQDLASRVLVKSSLYKQAAGSIMGARQWVEDRLDEAQSQDDVLAVPTVGQRMAELTEAQQ